MNISAIEKELRNFLDSDGKLIRYPAKGRLKILSLFYLSSKLDAGKKYTEKQVNEVLNAWHCFSDWAMLRRDLCDRHFLGREKSGAFYWLEENQPTLEGFGLALIE